MLFSTWAWNIICAPDVFTWNFAFMLMNMAQVFHILYQLRPVKFDPELEEAYHTLFEPFKVCSLDFYDHHSLFFYISFPDCSLRGWSAQILLRLCPYTPVKRTRYKI